MKEYIVAAVDRNTSIRQAITKPMTKERAEEKKAELMKWSKKYYKYFHVARHPYKPRKMGDC